MPQRQVKLPVLQAGDPLPLDAALAIPTVPYLPDDVSGLRLQSAGSGTLRTSSYTIYVDLPGNAEEMLLLHAYTGAYDRVSRRVATYVRSLEPKQAPRPLYGDWSPEPTSAAGEAPTPSDQTIERLRKRGYLTRMTPAEEEAYFCRVVGTLHLTSLRQRPGYILMPTYQCNLRCAYCFQDHMRTDPAYTHLLRLMSREMVDRIWLGMSHIEAVHGLPPGGKGRAITLFGGEPLLRESRPLIEYIVNLARAAGEPQLSAISNGTELDAYDDLLGPEGISMIQITLDGPPDEHDRRRVYADGSGSFERIARNLSRALELGTQISVRMNIDRGNIDRLPRLAEEFIRRGWTEHPRFSSYVAPVTASNGHVDTTSVFNSWELGEALTALRDDHPEIRHIGTQDDNLLSRARQIFDSRRDPLPQFKSSFCGAHNTMYVIDAFGDIYACWERTGDPGVRIGAIAPSGEVRVHSAMMSMWRRRNVTSNLACRKCRYATYCGGGCAIVAEEHHGTIFANHCDGFAKRFRKSVATAFGEHVSGAAPERRALSICDM